MIDQSITLAAMGDLSFMGRHADHPSPGVLSPAAPFFKECDLAIANLEGPLELGSQAVGGKCCLRSNPGWAGIIRDLGINMVTLANNHSMDYGEKGLFYTMRTLESAGIAYVGAGKNIKEACAPKILHISGKRLAFLGRTSVIVSSKSYAEENQPGVAFLDVNETKQSIKKCKESSDYAILFVHWGLEEYLYPSPEQRELAKEFMNAGADLILGHHPHVLQGIERMGNSLVAYSLGNFLMDEFEWSLDLPGAWQPVGAGKIPNPLPHDMTLDWRKTIILKIEIDKLGLIKTSETFTKLNQDTMVVVDADPNRKKEFDALSEKFGSSFYKYWWRLYAARREWALRIKTQVLPKNILRKIWKLRPRHIKQLFLSIRRSAGVAKGTTTNPYE